MPSKSNKGLKHKPKGFFFFFIQKGQSHTYPNSYMTKSSRDHKKEQFRETKGSSNTMKGTFKLKDLKRVLGNRLTEMGSQGHIHL